MADKKSWVMYDSWIPLFTTLPQESAANLILDICKYRTDKSYMPDDPMVLAPFVMIKEQMDKDEQKYMKTCESRAESGREGGKAKASKSKQMLANASKSNQKLANLADKDSDKDSDKDKDSEKDKESEYIEKPKRTQASLVGESDLSDPVKEKLMEWLKYKKERKDKFGETALINLITTIRKHEQESGSTAVINLISLCMSNGWQGIIWDKLEPTDRSGTSGTVFDAWDRA